MYTVPPSIFGRPVSRLPWGLLSNTGLTFLLQSIQLPWPIQFSRLTLTNERIFTSPDRCINSLLCRFILFSFAVIPPKHSSSHLSFKSNRPFSNTFLHCPRFCSVCCIASWYLLNRSTVFLQKWQFKSYLNVTLLFCMNFKRILPQ